ncbi:MAG: hypothetical protein LQ351_002910 [Letrouitia transgressa]|nr:MAG: hypothetical protein LQ351_002910 [Letrouitia transgressa]
MQSSILIALATGLTFANAQAGVTTGKLGDAAIVNGNPLGVTYTATLPNRPDTNIRGYISGTSNSNGTGVNFNINLSGFPSPSLGPFLYHVHDQPVPADGNCTKTLAHLDPYIRGEDPPCDPTQPATCQSGDLSGKHGKISTDPFQATYLDLYLSTAAGPGSFFGNRSVVIHTANKTRLTCANFTLTSGNGSSVAPSGSGTGTVTGPTASPSPFTGGAAANAFSLGAVAVGLAALFW